MTIEPIRFGQAIRQAEMPRTMEVADEMEGHLQELMSAASDRRPAPALTGREEESTDGFTEMSSPASSPSRRGGEELERASGEIERVGRQARLEFQWMHGSRRRR